ncbi:MAG: imidazole glycerol phosphate synthase subunit HisH [Sarcina sp.]
MITIIDYEMGNLKSISNALNYLDISHEITSNKEKILKAEKIILPGVGAFRDSINLLEKKGFADILKRKADEGTPILGICLGMQLLFEKSYEGGEYNGLGLIKGEVMKLSSKENNRVKIPHMGWNDLIIEKENSIIREKNNGDYVYFVHSYYGKVKEQEDLVAYSVYGDNKISAIVGRKNVLGTQFHPEKSGTIGLEILKRFGEMR